jgi:phosphohistidine phosphatase
MATPIELYLVLHAIAADRGPEYPDDRRRPLTPEGTARWRKAVKGLRAMGMEVDLVLTSPLLRARDTADLLAAGLAGTPPVEESVALEPGGQPAEITQVVARLGRRHRRLALVGHEPDLGELAARLLRARGAVEFKKGAVCRIDVDVATPGGPGTLRWFLPPRVLRMLTA